MRVQGRWVGAILCAVFGLTTPVVAGEPRERLEIVDRAIEYHGGSHYLASRSSFVLRSKSGEFAVECTMDGGSFAHVVEHDTPEGRRRVESTNQGVKVFLAGAEKPVAPGEVQRLRDFVSARLYFPFLPFRLNDPGVLKEDLGRESWNGEELAKVRVTFVAGSSTDASDEYFYWFEPATGRLVQFAYKFYTGKGGIRFRRLLEPRRVGGLLLADQDNYGLDGLEHRLEELTPAFVTGKMTYLSRVEIVAPRVESLRAGHKEVM